MGSETAAPKLEVAGLLAGVLLGSMVPMEGLEPPRGFPHHALNVACLPISPHRHEFEARR